MKIFNRYTYYIGIFGIECRKDNYTGIHYYKEYDSEEIKWIELKK